MPLTVSTNSRSCSYWSRWPFSRKRATAILVLLDPYALGFFACVGTCNYVLLTSSTCAGLAIAKNSYAILPGDPATPIESRSSDLWTAMLLISMFRSRFYRWIVDKYQHQARIGKSLKRFLVPGCASRCSKLKCSGSGTGFAENRRIFHPISVTRGRVAIQLLWAMGVSQYPLKSSGHAPCAPSTPTQ